jgi:hypothetical protein
MRLTATAVPQKELKSMTSHYTDPNPPEERYTPGPSSEDVTEREAVEAVEDLSFQQLELAITRFIALAGRHALEDTRARCGAEIVRRRQAAEAEARDYAEAEKRQKLQERKERSDKNVPRVRRAS